jgi:hypothetical protein
MPPKTNIYDNLNKALFDYRLIVVEKNIIWAERAFMANSMAQWCIKKIKNKEFSQKQIESFGKILFLYLRNKLDLCWKGEMLHLNTKGGATRRLEFTNDENTLN